MANLTDIRHGFPPDLTMCEYYIAGSSESPEVCFDTAGLVFAVSGNCYPANPDEFFTPMISWLDSYFRKNEIIPGLIFNFNINYINSSSYKYLLHVLNMIKQYAEMPGREIIVNWYYYGHDFEMLELGETISQKIEFPFNMVLLT